MTDRTVPPTAAAEVEARLTELERHVAHLEAAQADMSEVLAQQWAEIDRLTRTVRLLHNRLGEIEPPQDAKRPPHY